MTTEHEHQPADEAPRARIGTVQRGGTLWSVFEHTIAEGTNWRAALSRDYWFHHADRLRPGCRVEIHAFDHSVQIEMRVIDVNAALDPFYLDAVFVPLCPVGLELPQMSKQRQPRYVVRQAAGGGALFQ